MRIQRFSYSVIVNLAAALAGCGDGGGGGGADANIRDAAPDATPTGRVTVMVLVEGAPAADIPVMLHTPDGSFVRTQMSGVDGFIAFEDIPASSAVTAAFVDVPAPEFAFVGGTTLRTVADVHPGDSLTLRNDSALTLAGTYNAKLSDGSSLGGNIGYTAYAGGSAIFGSGLSYQRNLFSAAINSNGNLDGVAYARDPSGRLGYATLTDVPLVGAAPNNTAALDFGVWQTGALDQREFELNVTAAFADNNPAGSGTGLSLRFVRDRVLFDQVGVSRQGIAGTVVATTTVAPGFYDTVLTRGTISFATAGTPESSVLQLIPNGATKVTIVADTDIPGELVAPTIGGDIVRPSATLNYIWRCVDGSTGPAVAEFRLLGFGGAPTALTHVWHVYDNPTVASTLRVPELDPALVSEYFPAGLTDFQYGLRVGNRGNETWESARNSADVGAFVRDTLSDVSAGCIASVNDDIVLL